MENIWAQEIKMQGESKQVEQKSNKSYSRTSEISMRYIGTSSNNSKNFSIIVATKKGIQSCVAFASYQKKTVAIWTRNQCSIDYQEAIISKTCLLV